jgi:type VI secretion system protein ImpK
MKSPLDSAGANLRTNSLAFAFQDVLTTILWIRHPARAVPDAIAFRQNIKRMISAAGQQVRSLGYSDETTQMALYAMIGFLDESVLSSRDRAFSDWAGNPLQAEMFGGFFAGEYFFRHVNDLLNRSETLEVADALELHALCLLLGYRGRFAFGDSSEIHNIIRRIQDKIARIRGPIRLLRIQEAPEVRTAVYKDAWIRRLAITALVLVLLTIVGFAFYKLRLDSGLANINTAARTSNTQDFGGLSERVEAFA